jgi:peptidoglycan/LPS O-acetylase OafA/YrhL
MDHEKYMNQGSNNYKSNYLIYRPDIDGLRAIAVLLVVLFHAFSDLIKLKFNGFGQGGFIGVDIFFVISGFLISSIIFKNLKNDTFSFSDFYIKRIKRIFPSLITVLTFSFFFGWFALFSDEYKQLGKHILGAASYINNFMFWQESGYFDSVSETKPLLHLWSLSIEEQFYIFWPFLLWVLYKRIFIVLPAIILVAFISFYLHLHELHIDRVAAFYAPQLRIWELIVGSIVSYFYIFPSSKFLYSIIDKSSLCFLRKKREEVLVGGVKTLLLPNILSISGLILIILGVIFITKEKYFPGWWALLSPVLATALLIIAGNEGWVNKNILSNKVLVWFGLISYPLYLWHWPMLSFARIIEGETPSILYRLIIVLISISLAALTYLFIERPVRFHAKKRTCSILIFLILFIGLIGYQTYKNDGFPKRVNAFQNGLIGDIGHLDFHKYIANNYFDCTPKKIFSEALKWDSFVRCAQSKNNSNLDLAIIGDSHIEHLFIGIANALPNKNVVFYIKGSSPYLNNPDFKIIFNSVLNNNSIKKVILGSYWFDRGLSENDLMPTLQVLLKSGKDVYIVDDIPTFDFDPSKCKSKRKFSISNKLCEIDKVKFEYQRSKYIESFNEIHRKLPEVKLILLKDYLCNLKKCSMEKSDMLLYRDNNHLNILGSKYIGEKIVMDYLTF